MKIIFLDFDGVINNIRMDCYVEPLFVDSLMKVINSTGAKVVVTSNRRDGRLVNALPDLDNSLCYRNYIKPLLNLGIEIYDYVPILSANEEDRRELEIESYLLTHSEIEEFVIIEDDYVMKRLYDHQVFIEHSDGFTSVYIAPAINILNGNCHFYPPSYDISETFEERVRRLFPSDCIHHDPIESEELEEMDDILSNFYISNTPTINELKKQIKRELSYKDNN